MYIYDMEEFMKDQTFLDNEEVIIQPSRKSRPLFGKVISANWNDSFREYAYYIELTSGVHCTAWERELRSQPKPFCAKRTLDNTIANLMRESMGN
jgi:hypothetical protein